MSSRGRWRRGRWRRTSSPRRRLRPAPHRPFCSPPSACARRPCRRCASPFCRAASLRGFSAAAESSRGRWRRSAGPRPWGPRPRPWARRCRARRRWARQGLPQAPQQDGRHLLDGRNGLEDGKPPHAQAVGVEAVGGARACTLQSPSSGWASVEQEWGRNGGRGPSNRVSGTWAAQGAGLPAGRRLLWQANQGRDGHEGARSHWAPCGRRPLWQARARRARGRHKGPGSPRAGACFGRPTKGVTGTRAPEVTGLRAGGARYGRPGRDGHVGGTRGRAPRGPALALAGQPRA